MIFEIQIMGLKCYILDNERHLGTSSHGPTKRMYSSGSLGRIVHPMDIDGVQEFTIDKTIRKKCTLKANKYFVKKVRDDDGDYIFFASTDKTFPMLPEEAQTEFIKYTTQIGYSYCEVGQIHKVSVNEGTMKALECGIATILSTLCMIDPTLITVSDANMGIAYLDNRGDKGIKTKVKQCCSSFIALTNTADPKAGAYAYFSAARNSGYNEFLIQNQGDKKYETMTIEDARKAYNPEVGKIEGYENVWNFCKTNVR